MTFNSPGQLVSAKPCIQRGDRGSFFLDETGRLPSRQAGVRQIRRCRPLRSMRPASAFVRLKPTVAAYPRAALRVPVALRSGRDRKRVTAPPTESRRWPESPGSVRQIPLGGLVMPTASLEASGVGRVVCADHSGHTIGVRTFVRADRFAPAWVPERSAWAVLSVPSYPSSEAENFF